MAHARIVPHTSHSASPRQRIVNSRSTSSFVILHCSAFVAAAPSIPLLLHFSCRCRVLLHEASWPSHHSSRLASQSRSAVDSANFLVGLRPSSPRIRVAGESDNSSPPLRLTACHSLLSPTAAMAEHEDDVDVKMAAGKPDTERKEDGSATDGKESGEAMGKRVRVKKWSTAAAHPTKHGQHCPPLE